MESAIIALLIASLIGTAVTAGVNAYNVNKTNQQNKDLAAIQNQWNLEQWQRQNAYNEPQSQVQRLAAAGINPSLAVGQSGLVDAGNAQQSHPAAGATMQPFQMEDLGSFGRTGLSAMVQQSQIEANEAYAANQTAQANDINQMLPEKIRHIQAEYDNLKQEHSVMESRIRELEASVRNLDQDTAKKAFEASHVLWIEKNGDRNYQLELERFNETVPTLRAAASKDNSLASYWSSMKKLTDADLELARLTLLHKAVGVRIDNVIKYQNLGLGRQQFMLNVQEIERGEEILKQLQFNTTKMGFDNPFTNFIHSANDNFGNTLIKQAYVNAKSAKILFDGIVDSYRPFIDAGSRLGAASSFSNSSKHVFMHYGK